MRGTGSGAAAAPPANRGALGILSWPPDVPLRRRFRHVLLAGETQDGPRTHWRDYVSCLVLEHLAAVPEELGEDGQGLPPKTTVPKTQIGKKWNKREQVRVTK